MPAPPLASDVLVGEPLGWTGAEEDVNDDGWGWVEIFLAIQLLWGTALFVPGAQAVRTPVRALPYLASAAALLYYFRTPSGEALHGSARWLMASFGLLTLNLLHATTHSLAGVEQIVFQISIAAPIFRSICVGCGPGKAPAGSSMWRSGVRGGEPERNRGTDGVYG